MKWFSIWWYRYLFRKADDIGYVNWWTRLKCRYHNHPAGVWWYNSHGLEPDWSCKGCGDEL